MAITKLFLRYTFSDPHLNTVFRDYKTKINELTESQAPTADVIYNSITVEEYISTDVRYSFMMG